jgi:uncharacterized protein YcnI
MARNRCRKPSATLWLTGLTIGVIATLFGAAPASAHVTVHPTTLPAGSSDVELTFRVPNERDNANTVTLQVFFPTDFPLLTVDVLPVPGWSATVQTQNLARPVQTDDGPVSQIVSDVTWKATNGGIAPGQYEDFPVAAGSVPDHPGQLVFKALQTYSSAEIVRWIEVPTAGVPEPDNPAPILTLTPTSASTVSSGTTATSRSAPASTTSNTADVIAIVALAISVLSLGAVAWLWTRRSRRPSAHPSHEGIG